MTEWKPYEGGTTEKHWIDLQIKPEEKYSCVEMRAAVKWDGCIHLHTYSNGIDPDTSKPEEIAENSEYLHICDLDDFIQDLIALRDRARQHFGEEWPT